MITYEYECRNTLCRHTWSVEQKITDEPIKICPCCEKPLARRLISGGGAFQLSGSGWAKDGYK